jgi:hypothetical protein
MGHVSFWLTLMMLNLLGDKIDTGVIWTGLVWFRIGTDGELL